MAIQINSTPGMTADPTAKPNTPPSTTPQRGDSEPRTPRLAEAPQDPNKEAAAESPRVTEEALSESVSQINDFVQTIQRNVQFRVDEDSGRTVVTVIDRNTDEIIRQVPADEVLAMATKIKEQMDETLLFEAQA